jgi:hypothetical protein
MHVWKRLRLAAMLVVAATFVFALTGCQIISVGAKSGIKFNAGKMLHLQQVLERYDADGNAVAQYLELWLTKDTGRCVEMDSDGKEISVAMDTGKSHLLYDSATLKAEKSSASLVFTVGFDSMKKAYPKLKTSNDGQYAGRACTLYLMDNGKEDEWVKLYVDKETGYVLLCDAPTFRLRTALIEELPTDNSLFAEPKNLIDEGGDGK